MINYLMKIKKKKKAFESSYLNEAVMEMETKQASSLANVILEDLSELFSND